MNNSYVLENIHFNSHPAVVHGNGLSKLTLNSYTNYIPNKWSSENGCNTCYNNILDLSTVKVLVFILFYIIFYVIYNLVMFILYRKKIIQQCCYLYLLINLLHFLMNF